MCIVFRRLDSLRGMGVQGEGKGKGRGIDSGKADLAMLVVASFRGPLLTSQWQSTDCHIIFLIPSPSPFPSCVVFRFLLVCVCLCVLILEQQHVSPLVSPPSWPG